MSKATSSQRDFQKNRAVGREAGRLRLRSTLRLVKTQRKNKLVLQALLGEPNAFFSEQAGAESDACWQEVCRETNLYRSNVEKLRKDSSLCKRSHSIKR